MALVGEIRPDTRLGSWELFCKIIACEIAFREICYCAAMSKNLHDPEFLTEGYHDNPPLGMAQIQQRIDAIPEGRYDAILLGYGLCNNIVKGLTARHTALVIPRAHDCITFFLGSKERYDSHFKSHPGTYYYTSGWLEYRERGGDRVPRKQGADLGDAETYEDMVAKYGEDNARYLQEVMGNWMQNYSRGCLISFSFNDKLNLREQVQKICEENRWQFEETDGDLQLLQRWLDGDWHGEDFLVVQPGETVQPSYETTILCTSKPSG